MTCFPLPESYASASLQQHPHHASMFLFSYACLLSAISPLSPMFLSPPPPPPPPPPLRTLYTRARVRLPPLQQQEPPARRCCSRASDTCAAAAARSLWRAYVPRDGTSAQAGTSGGAMRAGRAGEFCHTSARPARCCASSSDGGEAAAAARPAQQCSRRCRGEQKQRFV